MTPSFVQKARRSLRVACILAGTALALLLGGAASLQAQEPEHPPLPPEPGQVQTFFLKNVRDNHQLNDIQTALRNMLNRARIYGDASENAIIVRGTEEDLAAALKLIAELDRPMKVYRVTYTITDLDNGKRTGAHIVSRAGSRQQQGHFETRLARADHDRLNRQQAPTPPLRSSTWMWA